MNVFKVFMTIFLGKDFYVKGSREVVAGNWRDAAKFAKDQVKQVNGVDKVKVTHVVKK